MKILKISKVTKKAQEFTEGVQSSSPNALDGRSKASAKNLVYKTIDGLTRGFFKDDYWLQINKILETLSSKNIQCMVNKTEYYSDPDDPDSSIKGKRWLIEIPFRDNTGKDKKLKGMITADFGGSQIGETNIYDVTFVVS